MRKFLRLSDLAAEKGNCLGTSDWVLIDQPMIDAFAKVTGDEQWIHIDPERTRKELDMSTIAHGYLTLSLLPRFMSDVFTVESVKRFINYGSNKIRFLNMVPVDSEIRGRAVLQKAVLGETMLRAVFEITVELKGAEKPVAVFEAIALLYEEEPE